MKILVSFKCHDDDDEAIRTTFFCKYLEGEKKETRSKTSRQLSDDFSGFYINYFFYKIIHCVLFYYTMRVHCSFSGYDQFFYKSFELIEAFCHQIPPYTLPLP